MSLRDARLLRAYLDAKELTVVQLANLAGVTTAHCSAVQAGKQSPEPALERLLSTVDLATVAKALAAEPALPPVASIAPASPIAAAMAEVQLALQAEADESRDLARSVTEAAQRYASVVEESIAHRMLASVGRTRGSTAPDVQGAALDLFDAVQRIPELSELLSAPLAPAPVLPAPAIVTTVEALADAIAGPPVGPSVPAATNEHSPLDAAAPSWPLLTLASRTRRLLIAGGFPNPRMLSELRGHGLTVEWFCSAKTSRIEQEIEALASGLRHSKACGLVFVRGALLGRYTTALRDGAEAGGVPTAYAGTGGRTAMTTALDSIEASLRNHRARKAG